MLRLPWTSTILTASLVTLVAIAGFLLFLWRKNRNRVLPGPPGISLLLRESRALNTHVLADLLSEVTGRSVRNLELEGTSQEADSDEPAGDCVTGGPNQFVALLDGTAFTIATGPRPSSTIRSSESFSELRLKKAIKNHTAWISMDVVFPAATPDAYRLVGRVMARLIGIDCLALYHAPLVKYVPCCGDETIAALRSDDPVRSVFVDGVEPPVIPIDDDPRLLAAEAEARRRFPEFEAAFQTRDGKNFSIKTLVTREGNSEHIWIDVENISGVKIYGRLGNKPVDLGDLRIGSSLEINVDQVEDWIFERTGATMGIFTLPVIQEILQERRRP